MSASIGIGVAGLGAAGRAFLPAIRAHGGFTLAAVAEPVEHVRAEVAGEHGVAAYATLDAMLADAGVDAVYIATPTELHATHAELALGAGKHVLVEKPMAADLDGARAMIGAAARANRVLQVGHSHSYDLPIRRMRDIVEDGALGRVRMAHTWCYTDWVRRPRRAEELDSAKGGGVTFRQGSHQFDVLRLLCGGMVRSVKARTFDWDPDRRTTGAHVVYLDFDDGVVATAVYNGYGSFASAELCFDIGEWGFPQPPHRARVPRAAAETPDDELRAKQERARHAIPGHAPHPPFFGLTLLSCERGDIRQSPHGLYVYSAAGRSEIELPVDASPRDLVTAEFHDAIAGLAGTVHDGRWGLANLEVCVAAIASSRGGREVLLHEQVPVAARLRSTAVARAAS